MIRYLVSALLGAIVVAGGGVARADFVIYDTVQIEAYHGTSPIKYFNGGTQYFGDVLGPFNTTQLAVVSRDFVNGDVKLKFYTQFIGADSGSGYADIFIDTHSPDKPDSFNYAISVGDEGSASQVKCQAADGTVAVCSPALISPNNGGLNAGLYSVNTYKTSQDIWASKLAYVYGGKFKRASDPDSSAQLAPTVLTGGNQLNGVTVTSLRTASPDAWGYYFLTVDLSASSDAGKQSLVDVFSHFDILWGTGDCSNDAIWGEVPAVPLPPAALLMAMGIVGLFGFARRERRRSTALTLGS